MFKNNTAKNFTLLPGNQSLGQKGEEEACNYLIKKGYSIPIKNWRVKHGEIDLIGIEKDVIVFLEVKTRYDSAVARTHLFDNISKKKQYKLRTLASIFIENNWRNRKKPRFRIDVMGVLIDRDTDKVTKIIHIENAC